MSYKNHPLRRQTDLLVQTVGDELIVYDQRANKAYLLNPSANAVWQACDGKRTVLQIAAYLNSESPTSEQAVWYALGQFSELLDEPVMLPQRMVGITRRGFLKMSGAVAAGVAVPSVIKMASPTPAQAASSVCCVCTDGFAFFTTSCEECANKCDATVLDCPAEPVRCAP